MCSSTNERQEFHHQEDSCLNCETPSWSFSTLLTSDVATEDVILWFIIRYIYIYSFVFKISRKKQPRMILSPHSVVKETEKLMSELNRWYHQLKRKFFKIRDLPQNITIYYFRWSDEKIKQINYYYSPQDVSCQKQIRWMIMTASLRSSTYSL